MDNNMKLFLLPSDRLKPAAASKMQNCLKLFLSWPANCKLVCVIKIIYLQISLLLLLIYYITVTSSSKFIHQGTHFHWQVIDYVRKYA